MDCSNYLGKLCPNLDESFIKYERTKLGKMKEECYCEPFNLHNNYNKQYSPQEEYKSKVPEILFTPRLCGKNEKSIVNYCIDSINKTEIELRKKLYNNIVLSGGNSMFKGLKDRLTQEIHHALGDSDNNLNIIASPERKFAAWIGGKVLSSLPTFGALCITKEEYLETGPSIIHKKIF